VAGLNSLSDHPAAPDPETRPEHLLVDFADAVHRQFRDEFYVLGAWAEPFRALTRLINSFAFGRVSLYAGATHS